MTVTYTGRVANARLCGFSRLLFYWKGSIYKLVYKEMIIFIILYCAAAIIYRLLLQEWQKRIFEHIVLYCQTFTNLIPLSFILGFYVAIVVTRWWNQFINIPWPDRCMMYVTTLIEGLDEKSRLIRRTIMRQLSLASLIVFQATSVSVKKRFPTMDHLLEAGVITETEIKALENIQTPHGKWWVPFVWIFNILKEARSEGRICDDYLLKTVMDEILSYRTSLGLLYSYDWISIPLVYTQVTTLAVYTFFLGCVLGRQFLDPSQNYEHHDVDLYVPVFTLLQFFFYMGWLKVAEQMINPFGEDDDDFDMNWIIDRNLQVSLLAVDDMHMDYPKMEKDIYWDEQPPEYLPYTKSAVSSITRPFIGSTADISVSDEGMKIVNPMDTILEGVTLETPQPQNSCNNIHSNININHHHSNIGSPLSSPGHSRRLHGIYGHLKPNFSVSKVNMDCHTPGERSHNPVLHHANVRRAASYLESWLQSSQPHLTNSRSELSQHAYTEQCRRSTLISETPTCLMSPTSTMNDLNLERRLAEATLERKLAEVEAEANGNMVTDKDIISANKTEELGSSSVVIDIPENSLEEDKKYVEEPKPVLTVAIAGSNGSIHEYAVPDSTHSTVTSITPLLNDDGCESLEGKISCI